MYQEYNSPEDGFNATFQTSSSLLPAQGTTIDDTDPEDIILHTKLVSAQS